MSRLTNPFFFESPSDRWAFTDRETLVPRLTELMQQRGRRLLLLLLGSGDGVFAVDLLEKPKPVARNHEHAALNHLDRKSVV